MKNFYFIPIILLIFTQQYSAQYFSPEAFVIHHLQDELFLNANGNNVNVNKKDTGDSLNYITKIKSHLETSANHSAEGRYKTALENAMLAARLSQKINSTLAWDLSLLMETVIYYHLQSSKNLAAFASGNVSNNEVAYQLNYLHSYAYLQLGEYEKCVALCKKITNSNYLSNYDRVQVQKLLTLCLEKQSQYSKAYETTIVTDSLLKVMSNQSFIQSTHPKLFYTTLANENFDRKIQLEKLINKNNMGLLLFRNGLLSDAEKTFLEVQQLASENKQPIFQFQSQKNLGLTATLLRKYNQAEDHYQVAQKISNDLKSNSQKAELLCLRGKNMYLANNILLASEFCKQSVGIAEAERNYNQLSQSYAVLAEINAYVGDIQKASFYARLAEENANRAKNELLKSNTEEEINKLKEEVTYDVFANEKAELELIQLKLEATRRFQELEIIKRENQVKESNLMAQKLESEKAQQNLLMIKRELETLNQLKELEEIKRDRSISILEIKNNQTKIRLLNKQRKLDVQIKAQRERDVQLAKKNERYLRNFLIVSLIVTSLIVFLFYRNIQNSRLVKSANQKLEELTDNLKQANGTLENTLQEVSAKNEIIETKNLQIIESITYAKRIQQASLPKQDEISNVVHDGFVINKPKDIISGDFYIVHSFKNSKGHDNFIYIVGDCTGHGVPGAMLSLLCSSLVRQAMSTEAVKSPAALLDEVNEKLRNFFRNKADDSFKDGMDIACCLLDKTAKKLYFSGAGRPMVHTRLNQVTELKGEKHHIGFSSGEFQFTEQELEIEAGDCIYLFSDGYTDQFSSVTRKRFMTKNLKDLLATISSESMTEQARLLEEAFDAWRGDHTQMDDVCIMGIRI